jgi:hypothetical protein
MTLSNEKAARLIKAGRDLEKLLAASEALNTFLEIYEDLEEHEGLKIHPMQISGDFVEGLPDDFIATSENKILFTSIISEVKKGLDDLSKGLLNSFHAEEGGPIFKPVTLKAKGLKMKWKFDGNTGSPADLLIDLELQRKVSEETKKMDEDLIDLLSGTESND